MDKGFYDHAELERAIRFMKQFKMAFGEGANRPYANDELVRECCKMA